MSNEVDQELKALESASAAFNMVDKAAAIRMLAYLQHRFVDHRPEAPKSERDKQ